MFDGCGGYAISVPVYGDCEKVAGELSKQEIRRALLKELALSPAKPSYARV